MSLFSLAFKSLKNRRFSALLTLIAIALSVCLLLSVERIRTETKRSFASTISGTDLIVGARSGSINLLLYSVFRIGNATNNIRWSSFQHWQKQPQVKWVIPLSLGDSHKGYRVLGTNQDYLRFYQYGSKKHLQLAQGKWFAEDDPLQVVLGFEVAKALGYQLNDEVILAHGVAKVSLVHHDDSPFKVVGILQPTGTPVDRTLHISLEGMEAVHLGWHNGIPAYSSAKTTKADLQKMDLTPKSITAMLVGLNSKTATFGLQRQINQWTTEPLLAILPGVALQELWGLMSNIEKVLFIISLFVVFTGLIGMLGMILASLNERRREMAILRSLGAHPRHVASLLLMEAFILSAFGILLGVALLYLLIALLQSPLQALYGLYLPISFPSGYELTLLACVLGTAVIISLIPAIGAYRHSLADGLSIKL